MQKGPRLKYRFLILEGIPLFGAAFDESNVQFYHEPVDYEIVFSWVCDDFENCKPCWGLNFGVGLISIIGSKIGPQGVDWEH